MAWFKCNLVDSNILNNVFYTPLPVYGIGNDYFEFSEFSTDTIFDLDPEITFYVTQTGSGTPSATNPRDYVYTEQVVLTHTVTPDGGTASSSNYTMDMNFKVFAGVLYPARGWLSTTVYGVDMGLLTYTQRSTGVLQVTKDNILSVAGHDMLRNNKASVFCPVATINSQTTNQIRFNSDVTAANAASTFSGHYLVYELATGIFDDHFGVHQYRITANTTNKLYMTGSSHSISAYYFVAASVKKHLKI